MSGWKCSKIIFVNKQTTGFQGRHVAKLRITYKREWDGFQSDALCDSGFTYTFYFCHEKFSSPLHYCVTSLFDGLEDKYHGCGVDNLYMSIKFCKDEFNHPNKIKLHRIIRKGGRFLSSTVLQDEVQHEVEQEKIQGTIIAAELVGDTSCTSLLAVSVYDTKPVYFLTMVAKKICW